MWTARNGVLTRQPSPSEQELNFGHPLVRGLVFDMASPMTGSDYRNLVDGRKPSRILGVSRALQKYGSGHAVAQAADNGIDFGIYPILTTWPYSILVVTDSKNEAARKWLFSTRNQNNPLEMVTFGVNAVASGGASSDSAGTLYLYTVGSAGSQTSPTTGSAANAVQDGVHHYGVTCDAAGNVSYVVDGKLHSTNTQASNASTFNAAQQTRVAGFSSNSNTAENSRSQIITRVWNGRLLTEADFKAQFDNVWSIYKHRRRIFAVGTAGGGADLAGNAAAQASASGTLSVQVPLIGAATSVATASGALTTLVPLAGQAAAVSLASGTLSITVALTGSALANALATGALSTSIALSGSALANVLATGNLLAGGAGALAGNAAAQASASGALSTAIPLQGNASALAIAAGGLTTAVPLAGVAVAVSHVTGDLTVTVSGLSGAAVAQVLAAGTLSLQIALSGAAVAHAMASGNLVDGTAAARFVDPRYALRLPRRDYALRLRRRDYTLRCAA